MPHRAQIEPLAKHVRCTRGAPSGHSTGTSRARERHNRFETVSKQRRRWRHGVRQFQYHKRGKLRTRMVTLSWHSCKDPREHGPNTHPSMGPRLHIAWLSGIHVCTARHSNVNTITSWFRILYFSLAFEFLTKKPPPPSICFGFFALD